MNNVEVTNGKAIAATHVPTRARVFSVIHGRVYVRGSYVVKFVWETKVLVVVGSSDPEAGKFGVTFALDESPLRLARCLSLAAHTDQPRSG